MDGVPRLHQNLDDIDVLEVADIRDDDLSEGCHACFRSGSGAGRPLPSWLLSGLNGNRIGLVRIDAVFLDGVGHRLGLYLALIRERLERGDRNEVTVDFEVVAQLGT